MKRYDREFYKLMGTFENELKKDYMGTYGHKHDRVKQQLGEDYQRNTYVDGFIEHLFRAFQAGYQLGKLIER